MSMPDERVTLEEPCPHCNAATAEWCVTPAGRPYHRLHAARAEAAKRRELASLFDELRKSRDRVFRLRASVEEEEAFRNALIRDARAKGVSKPEIAGLAGVSAVRVKQVNRRVPASERKATE